MSAEVLSGQALAAQLKEAAGKAVQQLLTKNVTPKLGLVIATQDEAAQWYVQMISKAAATLGIATELVDLPNDTSQSEIAAAITRLAEDDSIHGIILQIPLEKNINVDDLRSLIPVSKDVDGANPLSTGYLVSGLKSFAPATAEAVMRLLEQFQVDLAGKHVAVVGRSRVVGKPLAHLLLNQDATVTICHSKTQNLAALTSQADIVIAAVGRAGLITKQHVKPGAVVVDVGTNMTTDGLVGDVDPAVAEVAGSLSPVPGGVGPVTTALLLTHTIEAAA